VISSTPGPHFTPGNDPVPILQEAGWAPGPVWTGRKSRPHRDSIPDHPARSSVAIPTELPDPPQCKCKCEIVKREVNNKARIVHEKCVNTHAYVSVICLWPMKNLAELAYGLCL